MLESKYQSDLIKRLKIKFPGCLVTLNDANYTQGLPDLTIFYRDKWAFLEVKASEKSKERPNQRYYINQWCEQSFAAFIYPEIEDEVLTELSRHMGVCL